MILITDLILILGLFYCGVYFSPFEFKGVVAINLLYFSIFYSLVFVIGLDGFGLYEKGRLHVKTRVLKGVLYSGLLALILTVFFAYFVFYTGFGRWTLAYSFLFSTAGVLFFRFVIAKIISYKPVLFSAINDSQALGHLLSILKEHRRENRYLRYCPIPDDIHGVKETFDFLEKNSVAELIVRGKSGDKDESQIDYYIQGLKSNISVLNEVEFYSKYLNRIPVGEVEEGLIISEYFSSKTKWVDGVSRVFDLVAIAIFIVPLVVLFMSIYLIIKVCEPGLPAVIVQDRMGRYQKPFKVYKFRTMIPSKNSGTSFTSKEDSRVTWIGKIIRPLHLDEIPQFYNIVKNDMSIVGCRPEMNTFANEMCEKIPAYNLRYLVKPGLTGYAQINMGYAMNTVEDTKEKLSFDFYYILNKSIWMDLKIIFNTIFRLTKGAR